ncbi:MAG: hypothetical protein GY832_24155 [Chloroflexi bacterium]|nr:hypothetical protein [Chloroflexota bacterium]
MESAAIIPFSDHNWVTIQKFHPTEPVPKGVVCVELVSTIRLSTFMTQLENKEEQTTMKHQWQLAAVGLSILCGLALLFLVLGPISSVSADAGIIYVAPDANCNGMNPCYGNVQEAVDAAATSDTIKIAGGIYTGVQNIPSLNFEQWGTYFTATQIVAITKTVMLQGGYSVTDWSTFNPDANPTVLNAQEMGRVVYVYGNPTIVGLRITGGNATGLGGDPWSGNDAGGGVYVRGVGSVIRQAEIVSNTAQRGGGIYAQGITTLQDNRIWDNHAVWYGGGVELRYSDSTLAGSIIHDNTAYIGAGIAIYGSDAMIVGNLIQGNIADDSGGGLSVAVGGVYGNPIFINNVLADNTVINSQGYGSAVSVRWDTFPEFVHTTIARNTGGDGSSIIVRDNSAITMTNTVLASHAVGISVTEGTTVTVNGVLWYDNAVDYGGSGIITVTNEYTGNPAFAADGYRLTNASAAIDHGVDSGITTDIDGQARDILPDLGADEYHDDCWVRINDMPADYVTVQAAVDASSEGDVVKVAGYCSGVSARAGVTQVVYISKTVTVQGGYTTTNWTMSDPNANLTTLDAQGQGRVLYRDS